MGDPSSLIAFPTIDPLWIIPFMLGVGWALDYWVGR